MTMSSLRIMCIFRALVAFVAKELTGNPCK